MQQLISTKTQQQKSTKIINSFIVILMIIITLPLFVSHANALYIEESQVQQNNTELKTDIVFMDPSIKTIQEISYTDYSTKIVNNQDVYDSKIVRVTNSKAKELEEFNKKLEEERIAKEKAEEEERLRKELEAKTVMSSRVTSAYDINVYTDLSVMNTITADQMNEIIDYWSTKCGGTAFVGQGQTFIDASKASGLDPVYILAHAAVESGWGNLSMSHNYFGIGAFDSDPNNGHNYGNSDLYSGIVNGAIWISNNYYNAGQTSLYTMRYNGGIHEYCTSETWMYNINDIIQTSYLLLE